MQDDACHPEIVASEHGWPDIVKWLRTHGYKSSSSEVCNYAASHGDLVLLRWLLANGATECDSEAMDSSARKGYFHAVKVSTFRKVWSMELTESIYHKWLHRNYNTGCTTRAMGIDCGLFHFIRHVIHIQTRLGCG